MFPIMHCSWLLPSHSAVSFQTPSSEQDWLDVADQFFQSYQVPHCLGAVDGKHISIQPPAHSGNTFRNYRGRFSVLLMAAVDAQYRFRYVSVGAQDRDAGVFTESGFRRALDQKLLRVPAAERLPGSSMEAPFMFLGGDGFPLRPDLLKPYPGPQMDQDQRVFNYRLSRGRRAVDNGFGVFASRWRVFRSTIMLSPDKVQKMLLACLCLHNYLLEVQSQTYNPPGLADSEGPDHGVLEGSWRADGLGAMLPLEPGGRDDESTADGQIRETLKKYFVSEGKLP